MDLIGRSILQSRVNRLEITRAVSGRGAVDTDLVQLPQLLPKPLFPRNQLYRVWENTSWVTYPESTINSSELKVQSPFMVSFEPQQRTGSESLAYGFGAGILQKAHSRFDSNIRFRCPVGVLLNVPVGVHTEFLQFSLVQVHNNLGSVRFDAEMRD